MKPCPMCEQGTLCPIEYTDVFFDNLLVEKLRGSYCNICNEIIILKDQILYNQDLIQQARNKVNDTKHSETTKED
jgi:hypothetical protein